MRILAHPIIGGAKWKIALSNPKETPILSGCQGRCVAAKHTIYINEDEVPPEGYAFVAAHEMGHADIFMCGGVDTLKLITGLKGAKYDALEEFITGALFHAHYDTLVRNGWLKIKLT